MKQVYAYHSENKKYMGVVECQLDPLETIVQGKDIYLIPADTTEIEPLEPKDGYDIVFNGAGWEYKEIPKEPEPEPLPEPTIEEKNETIKQTRAALYAEHVDPLHAQKTKDIIMGEWSDEKEQEYIAKVKELTIKIRDENPYIDIQ